MLLPWFLLISFFATSLLALPNPTVRVAPRKISASLTEEQLQAIVDAEVPKGEIHDDGTTRVIVDRVRIDLQNGNIYVKVDINAQYKAHKWIPWATLDVDVDANIGISFADKDRLSLHILNLGVTASNDIARTIFRWFQGQLKEILSPFLENKLNDALEAVIRNRRVFTLAREKGSIAVANSGYLSQDKASILIGRFLKKFVAGLDVHISDHELEFSVRFNSDLPIKSCSLS